MRHSPEWQEVLQRFEDNERSLASLPASEPMPEAQFCRESAHRTLGHLAACQTAWLPVLRAIRQGAVRVPAVEHPHRLFERTGAANAPWCVLLETFLAERSEWRALLESVDLDHAVKTGDRFHTAKTLTEKLVRHEAKHLEDLARLSRTTDSRPDRSRVSLDDAPSR